MKVTLQIKRKLEFGVLKIGKIIAPTIMKKLQISTSLLGAHNLKMLAIDLDGTSLTNDKKFMPETVKAIADFKKEYPERLVCIATGRGYYQGVHFAKLINADYFICAHGGGIWKKTKNDYQLEKSFTFPEQDSLLIYNKILECSKENPNLIWHLDTDNTKNCFIIYKEQDALKKANSTFYPKEPINKGVLQVKNFDDIKRNGISNNIIKICIEFGKHDDGLKQCQQFAQYLKQTGIAFECIGNSKLELVASNANKGDSLSIIIQKEGIKNSQVVAIGDQMNDVSMLEGKGFKGWCMGNGNKLINAPRLNNTNNGPDSAIKEAIEKSKLYLLHKEMFKVKKSISDFKGILSPLNENYDYGSNVSIQNIDDKQRTSLKEYLTKAKEENSYTVKSSVQNPKVVSNDSRIM